MDNINNAPVIPAGTSNQGGAAYNPLQASVAAQNGGQAGQMPDGGQAAGEIQQAVQQQPQEGQALAELMEKKGFKSLEDVGKAYLELESSFTRSQMGLAELSKLREDNQPVVANEVVQNPSQVQTPEDAVKLVEGIVRKVTRPLEDQLALQNLFMRNSDAPQYAEGMGKAIKDNPGISWEAAYKIAKFDSLGSTAKEQGKQEAYQTIAQKQAVAAGVARPAAQKDIRPVDELIMDKSIPFAEVQRIMRERFTQ